MNNEKFNRGAEIPGFQTGDEYTTIIRRRISGGSSRKETPGLPSLGRGRSPGGFIRTQRKAGYRFRAGLCFFYLFIFNFSLLIVSFPMQGEGTKEPEFIVKNGYHFGVCVGYSDAELVIEGRKAAFKKPSQPPDSRYPPVEVTRYLSSSEYNILKNLIEATEFVSAQDKYGCPDCYDQGAEWLEVTTPRLEKRIEMEYNALPPSIESLLIFMRKVRARLDESRR